MTVGYVIQQALNALQVSAFYALLAASYVLMHAITRRINFAFGALSIWAGYTFINLTLSLMLEFPGAVLLPLAIGGIVAAGHTALAGLVIEKGVVRPLVRESSLAMLVTTLGLAIALEEGIRLANDSRERWLGPIGGEPWRFGTVQGFEVMMTPVQIAGIAVAIGLAALLSIVIARHPFGRAWRACSQDLRMAELCGVDVGRTLAITFFIATIYAAAAGVLVALLYGVASFHGGFVIGLKTLFVAVVGGLSSVSGAFVGALVLGLFETFWSGTVGPDLRDAAAFFMLALLLILFPEGLLGGRGGTKVV
jgi:branched-chain amino acid transport system permease protein